MTSAAGINRPPSSDKTTVELPDVAEDWRSGGENHGEELIFGQMLSHEGVQRLVVSFAVYVRCLKRQSHNQSSVTIHPPSHPPFDDHTSTRTRGAREAANPLRGSLAPTIA